MSFLDQIGKSISYGVDRARFEADKFQRANRLQSELNDIKRRLDKTLIDMGQRAYELYRAGQISAPTIGAMAQTVDKLRAEVVIKEEALKTVQAETYAEPPGTTTTPAQPVPIVQEGPPVTTPPLAPPPAQTLSAPAPPAQPAPATKTCPHCQFQMPMRAVFCPNCGFRIGQ